MKEIVLTIISVLGTITTIIFAYIAFRRNFKNDLRNDGKIEGLLLSDIAYIKSSIKRMEEKLDKEESNYQMLLTRVIKVEQIYESISEKLENHILRSGIK